MKPRKGDIITTKWDGYYRIMEIDGAIAYISKVSVKKNGQVKTYKERIMYPLSECVPATVSILESIKILEERIDTLKKLMDSFKES